MKKTLLLLSVFVAAAIAFVGCQKENDAPVKTHKVTIFATQADSRTTVTEEEGKAVFTWTDEDMDNFHIFENGVAATTIYAEHQDGKVTILAEFPEQVAASYVYSGYLAGSTAQDGKCPAVGTEQTLGTTLYASSADVLVAEAQESATVATELNFSFKRPVAVSKMTIKNIPAGELVEKVTIKADKPLAGYFDMAEDAWVSGGNSIDVIVNKTVPEGDSIVVGFVTIPVEEATFTVKTSTYSKDFAKTFAKTLSLSVGRLISYKVNMSGCEVPLFYESFDKCAGEGGNDDKWSGSLSGSSLAADNLDNSECSWETGYAANKCVRFGTSKNQGSFTTEALGIKQDQNATITFKAGAWDGNSEKLTLSLELVGKGTLSENELTLTKAAWTDYSVIIAGGDADTKLTIKASQASNNRFFLDELKAKTGGEFTYLSISPADTTVASTATKAEIAVSASGAWTAVSTKGNTIAPASGTGNAEVVLSFAANTTSAEYKDTVTFTSGDKVKKFYLTQQPGAMQTKTIAEFIELADTENTYQLTGIVTGISYKNFNLTDATGTIYVYNFVDDIDFKNGDKLTLYGKYQYYEAQSKHEVVSGKYVSHVTTPKLSVDKSAIEVADDETSATFNILGTANWTITSSNPVVTLSKTSGTGAAEITLEFPENTSTTDAVTATITVSSEDEDVYASPCEISFTQAKKESGTLTTVDLPSYTTFTFSGSGDKGILTCNHSDFTIIQAKGTSSTSVASGNNTVGSLRIYGGNTLTFTSEYTIKKIEFTYTESKYSGGTISANTGVMSGQVWTGTSKNVVLSPSSQWRTATIKVTYLSTEVWNLSGIAVTTPPTKTAYSVDDKLDLTGMVVTATYSDQAGVKADKQVVVTEWTADPAEGTTLSAEGDVTVTVSYTDGVTKTATQKVTVSEGPKTYSCTFTSKSWGTSTGEVQWTSGKDGGQLTSGSGIQVTTTYSGANATTTSSYTNVSKIVVKYCTNTTSGVGTIKVQVGNGTEKSFSVTKPSSGGKTIKEAVFTFSPNETGKVKVTANCTTNSVYINGVAITAD